MLSGNLLELDGYFRCFLCKMAKKIMNALMFLDIETMMGFSLAVVHSESTFLKTRITSFNEFPHFFKISIRKIVINLGKFNTAIF